MTDTDQKKWDAISRRGRRLALMLFGVFGVPLAARAIVGMSSIPKDRGDKIVIGIAATLLGAWVLAGTKYLLSDLRCPRCGSSVILTIALHREERGVPTCPTCGFSLRSSDPTESTPS